MHPAVLREFLKRTFGAPEDTHTAQHAVIDSDFLVKLSPIGHMINIFSQLDQRHWKLLLASDWEHDRPAREIEVLDTSSEGLWTNLQADYAEQISCQAPLALGVPEIYSDTYHPLGTELIQRLALITSDSCNDPGYAAIRRHAEDLTYLCDKSFLPTAIFIAKTV